MDIKNNIMDFSMEGDFQERLLKRIKEECFSELSDDDLAYVNAAAAKPVPGKIITIIMPEQQ